jgi:hypothetical protein
VHPGGFLILTTDNGPNLLQRLRRTPVWWCGKYRQKYERPTRESVTEGKLSWKSQEYPILGHINLNPTRHWERLCIDAGFELAECGTYESICRGGASKSPPALVGYFALGAMIYCLLPRRMGRFFGDTTALLLRKPSINLRTEIHSYDLFE